MTDDIAAVQLGQIAHVAEQQKESFVFLVRLTMNRLLVGFRTAKLHLSNLEKGGRVDAQRMQTRQRRQGNDIVPFGHLNLIDTQRM